MIKMGMRNVSADDVALGNTSVPLRSKATKEPAAGLALAAGVVRFESYRREARSNISAATKVRCQRLAREMSVGASQLCLSITTPSSFFENSSLFSSVAGRKKKPIRVVVVMSSTGDATIAALDGA